jgi:phosphoribosylanthranilate isomerase
MALEIRLPKIKFCGLTRAIDVSAAIESGADAIGLNFYRPSPRYVSPENARELSQIAAGRVLRVGVFVNASPLEVDAVLAICPLDCVQLHGDEPLGWIDEASRLARFEAITFIKAVAWRGQSEDVELVSRWTANPHSKLLGLLVDAFDPVQRGGTGKTARWDLLFPRHEAFRKSLVLLAGGLTSENISSAIEIARPNGIDLASGIETQPGIKDLDKMQLIADVAGNLLKNSDPHDTI